MTGFTIALEVTGDDLDKPSSSTIGTEMAVDDVHYWLEKEEQPIVAEIKVELLEDEDSVPHKHLKQVTHFLHIPI